MLSNPAWVLEHWALVAAVVAAIVFGKAIVISGVALLFRSSPGHAVATGVCLAQVGEFLFVLAEVARHGQLIDNELFELIVAAAVVTLFLTPYLVGLAPRLAKTVGRLSFGGFRTLHVQDGASCPRDPELSGHIVIVGFGPAGQCIADELQGKQQMPVVVIELSAKSAAAAQAAGLRTYVGDATRAEMLEHTRVQAAAAVVVTIPDPATARHVIEQVRLLSPQTPVIARARYHRYYADLVQAGAIAVIDEERTVGLHLASAVRDKLLPTQPDDQ